MVPYLSLRFARSRNVFLESRQSTPAGIVREADTMDLPPYGKHDGRFLQGRSNGNQLLEFQLPFGSW